VLEKHLVNRIREKLKKLFPGILIIKIHGGLFQMAGLPDLIICYKGRFIALEVKLPGKEKTLTKLQKTWLRRVRKAGGIAYMITSVEKAVGVIQRIA
jgi:penicillin-binding protein-related factor A (putative recombinase)